MKTETAIAFSIFISFYFFQKNWVLAEITYAKNWYLKMALEANWLYFREQEKFEWGNFNISLT